MSATYHPGKNIVDDDADILVNCVNCVGVMGKVVALAFAKRWPEIGALYKWDCACPATSETGPFATRGTGPPAVIPAQSGVG